MRKLIITAVAVASLHLSNAIPAAEVTVATDQQGLTYNTVCGVNLVSALNKYGYSSTVTPDEGPLDNLDKVASGIAQIGFTQADAFQFWRSRHSSEAQKVDIIGELADEYIFVAVKKGGKISDEGDLRTGVEIVAGGPTSGSYASWRCLWGLERDYAKVRTYARGGVCSLRKVVTDEYDAFLRVSAPDRSNKFLEAVGQEDSGLTMIDMNGRHLGDKLSNGRPVHELKKAVTESGWLGDSEVKVPCTKALVVANTDVGNEVPEMASTVLLESLSRMLGTNGKQSCCAGFVSGRCSLSRCSWPDAWQVC